MLSFMAIAVARVIQWQRENHAPLELDRKNSYGKVFQYQEIDKCSLYGIFLSCAEIANELSQSKYLVPYITPYISTKGPVHESHAWVGFLGLTDDQGQSVGWQAGQSRSPPADMHLG